MKQFKRYLKSLALVHLHKGFFVTIEAALGERADGYRASVSTQEKKEPLLKSERALMDLPIFKRCSSIAGHGYV